MSARKLPDWMYGDSETSERNSSYHSGNDNSSTVDDACPLMHLLPRLREYFAIVDPNRVSSALEFLVNYKDESDLFSDLQQQYGDLPPSSQSESLSEPTQVHVASSGRPAKVQRRTSSKSGYDSDFVVSDDESASSDADADMDSELDEPEPEEDKSRSKPRPSAPVRSIPAAQPNLSTRPPAGPTTVCKYGKSCYRKNPVHFQEFAHPWLQ